MTDGQPVEIIRKLKLYTEVQIPEEGKPTGKHFVRLHGVLSESELSTLTDWLSHECNDGGDKEAAQ